MASEFNISLVVGAAVGGAISALRNVGRTMQDLGAIQARINQRRLTLQNYLQRSDVLSRERIHQLRQEYNRLGRDLSRLQRQQATIEGLRSQRQAHIDRRSKLKSELFGTIGTVASLAVPVKLAVDYESAMADVRKTVDFDTPEQFKEMGRDILDLTQKIPLAGTALAEIAAGGGQLGIARDDLLEYTETVAKMSVAFDTAAGETGESMAKLANVYKLPINQLSVLGDAINELSNNSPAKAANIVNTLGRVGGVARQFGLTELQAASLSNTMIALGKSPEVASTSINSMMTKLMTAEKGGKEFQAALAAMSLSAEQLKADIARDGEGALVGFMKRLNTLPKEAQMGLLVDLFGREYADDIAVLAGNVEEYERSIQLLNQTNKDGKLAFVGSMQKEFDARMSTTAAQWQLFKSAFTDVAITLGGTLLPALNEIMENVRPMVLGFAQWADANQDVVKTGMQVVGLLVGFKAGSWIFRFFGNEVLFAFKSLRLMGNILKGQWLLSSIRSSSGQLTKFGRVLKWIKNLFPLLGRGLLWLGRLFLATPIGLVLGLLGTAAYLLYTRWDEVCSGAKLIWQQLGDFFGGLWDDITTAFDGGIGEVSKLIVNWSPLGLFYKAFAGVLSWFGIELPSDFTGFIGNIWTAITEAISAWNPLDYIKESFSGVLSWFGSLGKTIKSEVTSWFSESESVMQKMEREHPELVKPNFARDQERQRKRQETEAATAEILRQRGISQKQYDSGALSTEQYRSIDAELRNRNNPLRDVISGTNQQKYNNPYELMSEVVKASKQGAGKTQEEKRPDQTYHISYAPNITVPAESQAQIQQIISMSLTQFSTYFKRMTAENERTRLA